MPKIKLPLFLSRFNTKGTKRKLLGLGIVVIVALVGFAGWAIYNKVSPNKNGKIYAQAAGHKIYKKDIDDFIGKQKGISEHQAATVLADKYLTEALAKEQGITVSDKDVQAQYGKDTLKQKSINKYAYQNKVNQVYLARLQAHNNGVYKGKILVANFSHHIEAQPSLPEDKMHDPLLGNADAIAKDKKYAQDFITNLYNQITSGKMTFDQAIQTEHNDPRLGLKAYPSLEHSGSFNTLSMLNGVIKADSIRQTINSIKAGETTKPFVVKVSNSIDNPDSKVESYFLVVHMDETSGSYTGMDFGQYLSQAKERLDYQVNV